MATWGNGGNRRCAHGRLTTFSLCPASAIVRSPSSGQLPKSTLSHPLAHLLNRPASQQACAHPTEYHVGKQTAFQQLCGLRKSDLTIQSLGPSEIVPERETSRASRNPHSSLLVLTRATEVTSFCLPNSSAGTHPNLPLVIHKHKDWWPCLQSSRIRVHRRLDAHRNRTPTPLVRHTLPIAS